MLKTFWHSLKLSFFFDADIKSDKRGAVAFWGGIAFLFLSYIWVNYLYYLDNFKNIKKLPNDFDMTGFTHLSYIVLIICFISTITAWLFNRSRYQSTETVSDNHSQKKFHFDGIAALFIFQLGITLIVIQSVYIAAIFFYPDIEYYYDYFENGQIVWLGLIYFKTILLYNDRRIKREVFAALLMAGVSYYILIHIAYPWFLYASDDYYDDGYYEDDYDPLVAEEVFSKQSTMVDDALASLISSKPGNVDVFLISMGVGSSQNVFMTEAQKAAESLGAFFKAEDRTITLVNNEQTLETYPLATITNLQQIIEKLDVYGFQKNEDVLVVYLTSHGSPEAKLETGLTDISMIEMQYDTLLSALDKEGIKWKAVIISACYSGSFIDHLKSPQTLVMTAASALRPSFGCSDDAVLTYYGRALLEDAAPQSETILNLHNTTRRVVSQREKEIGVLPSDPQIYYGHEIHQYFLKHGFETEALPVETVIENVFDETVGKKTKEISNGLDSFMNNLIKYGKTVQKDEQSDTSDNAAGDTVNSSDPLDPIDPAE